MKTAAIALLIALEVGCIYAYNATAAHNPAKKELKAEKKNGKSKKEKLADATPATNGMFRKTWTMPSTLNELSGHAVVDADRFACVQDEDGTIFIYNRSSQHVEQEIPFAGAGDYEDIALVGSTAYVMRSDGMLYEVMNYRSGKPTTRTYETGLTAQQNVEGLAHDAKRNRLLLAVKGKDDNGPSHKGIYAFDLATHHLASAPAYRLHLFDPMLQSGKKVKEAAPSAIAVHPATGDLYIVDGPGKRLLIMGGNSELKSVHHLTGLTQPEGIAIDAGGKLYISSEGGKGAAVIAETVL